MPTKKINSIWLNPSDNFQIELPKACQFVLEQFQLAGKKAYLVGGCVRDSIMGRKPKDWDVCTEATPEEMLELFAEEKVIPTGLQHGTITLMKFGMSVEITTYRIDGDYEDNRHPKEVFFTRDLREDLRRRDFTINAMAWHPKEGLIDYFDGIGDLQKGMIRCVGNPIERYEEDGLRMMRGIRFASVLEFELEEGTRRAIASCSYLLKNISKERIQVELIKIATSNRADYGIEALCCTGCMDYMIPELMDCRNFGQHGGLHQYDVFEHLVRSMMLVPEDVSLRLAMLLHDIGKPFVWQEEINAEGFEKDEFPGHEIKSAELAEQILKRLKFDNKTIQTVKILIGEHTRMLLPEAVLLRKAVRDLGFDGVRKLILVKKADIRAHSKVLETHPLDIFNEIETMLAEIELHGECCSLKQLAVSGQDLTRLGYKGKEIGDTLECLLDLVLEEPDRNTKDYLLGQVKASET